MNTQMLRIGEDFPKISLTDIENKTITIPDDIKTKYCILLFYRGAW
jgi:peroxiredoxin